MPEAMNTQSTSRLHASRPNRTPPADSAAVDRGRISVPRSAFLRREPPGDAMRVVDLFAGAGGFGLGFALAGAKVTTAVEIDDWASETLRANHPDTNVLTRDIVGLTDAEIARECRSADILIGGPPCQGFSVANLRAGDPKDPRNSLFREFVRVASILQPMVLLLENVPGLLRRKTESGERVIDVICDEYRRIGFRPHVRILQAQDYGVPQLRPRLFVLGTRNEWATPFPEATHSEDSASGQLSIFPDAASSSKLPPVSLWDAISDLPTIKAREGAEVMQYSGEPRTPYQLLLRADSEAIYNHVAMQHSARLVERFSKLKWGESGGTDVPTEFGARKRGSPDELSGKGYDQNNRRMYPDRPCHTIPASFYANFVHPYSDRNFTPREGARLQSFPDWYVFRGKPTVVSHRLLAREGRDEERHLCQYNQIGNAVPPLLAYHLGRHILAQLADKPRNAKDARRKRS